MLYSDATSNYGRKDNLHGWSKNSRLLMEKKMTKSFKIPLSRCGHFFNPNTLNYRDFMGQTTLSTLMSLPIYNLIHVEFQTPSLFRVF